MPAGPAGTNRDLLRGSDGLRPSSPEGCPCGAAPPPALRAGVLPRIASERLRCAKSPSNGDSLVVRSTTRRRRRWGRLVAKQRGGAQRPHTTVTPGPTGEARRNPGEISEHDVVFAWSESRAR